eukprot:g154.t1
MYSSEAAIVLCPAVVFLAVILPWVYYRKFAKQQWISVFCIELSKEWHKPNKAYISHLRSQARTDVLRVFQQEGIQNLDVTALDQLNDKLTDMEEKSEHFVRPICTPCLCLLVVFEAMQFLSVAFASKVKWDTESTWKIVPKVLGSFLPDPTNGGAQDVLSWIILMFLYSVMFCVLWLLVFGAFYRWMSCLRQDDIQEYMGNTFLRLLWIIRSIMISSKELLFDFGTLFIFTAIVRSSLNQDGELECYWPCAMFILCAFYGVSVLADQITYSTSWMSFLLRFFAFENAFNTLKSTSLDDHHYFKIQRNHSREKELKNLRIQFFGQQRPVFASKWTLLSGAFKLVLSVLYSLAHFHTSWAWTLLAFSTTGFLILLFLNIKQGLCTFHWVNICRSLGLITALWGNSCAFFAQGLNSNPELTYSYTPTIVYLSGLMVIIISAPFCCLLSLRLFKCCPVRIHPLKLQVIHAYYKFVALGRINSIKDVASMDQSTTLGANFKNLLRNLKFHRLLNKEHNSSSQKLLINHELWVTWIHKNSPIFKKKHVELSMQDEIRAYSKKLLKCEALVPEDHEHLQTAQKIRDWMKHAEMIIDPDKDIELGLHVPYDEYLTFSDGVPKFTSDPGQRIFPERSLRRIKVRGIEDKISEKGSLQLEDTQDGEAANGAQKSPRVLHSSLVLSSSAGTAKELKSRGSHPFIRAPCQDPMEKPNKVGSLADAVSVSSSSSNLESSRSQN